MQLTQLHSQFDALQKKYGEKTLCSVYGAGCVSKPTFCLIFMNPTARNISCIPERKGMRAPRIGFKQTRKMMHDLGFISDELFTKTQGKIIERTPTFVDEIYNHLANNGIYITNLAKCTQTDAKALPDSIFKSYLPTIYQEIELLQPKHIITFGNQVSSILLQSNIQVSAYENNTYESLTIGSKNYRVYPCRYPVGMGYRNIDKAKKRIQSIS